MFGAGLFQLMSYFDSRAGFTLQEALDMIYLDDIEEIFIEPPDPTALTDEDSADEDDGGTLDNLSGRQLQSKVEIKFANSTERLTSKNQTNDLVTSDNTAVHNDNISLPEKVRPKDKIIWEKDADIVVSRSRIFPVQNYNMFLEKSPVEIFEMFIDDSIIELFVRETQMYSLFKNCPDPQVTSEEMKTFIAILILSGYDPKPSKRHFWDSGLDMKNIMVSNSMRRDRFVQIMRFIHLADNNSIDTTDKMYKLRPLINALKTKCLQYFVPQEHLDFDESMIKYYGRHNCKQFIRGKPIRFGYKMWCLNAKDGYLVDFDMYQGRNPNAVDEYERLFGKCTAPFVSMLADLPHPEYPYKFYLDNLFMSLDLLNFLRLKGYGGSGTFRENRVPNSCPLAHKKTMQKKDRGSCVSAIDKNHGVIIVKWADNNIVTAGSNCYGVNPIGYVKRYSKAEKKFITVPRPFLIGQYNSSMGGTDLMDEGISSYRIAVRSKKWWWSIFTWLLDAAIFNSWVLYKKNNPISQLDFRRALVKNYLSRYGIAPKTAGRPSTSKFSLSLNRISDEVRYDRTDHLLMSIPNKKRRRCAGEGCSTSTRTMCKKCDIGLCIECNIIFHTQTM